jgi:hypothetical protein
MPFMPCAMPLWKNFPKLGHYYRRRILQSKRSCRRRVLIPSYESWTRQKLRAGWFALDSPTTSNQSSSLSTKNNVINNSEKQNTIWTALIEIDSIRLVIMTWALTYTWWIAITESLGAIMAAGRWMILYTGVDFSVVVREFCTPSRSRLKQNYQRWSHRW